MADYTPGPWHVDCDPTDPQEYQTLIAIPEGTYGTWVARTEHNWNEAEFGERRISWKEAQGNARRIVACVNACAGIPIEFLENGGVAKLVEALATIKAIPGNVDHDTPGGSNAAHARGGMVMDMKNVAAALLTQLNPQHAEAKEIEHGWGSRCLSKNSRHSVLMARQALKEDARG